jgi:imidazolonepropionase-like amidohydrolase
LVTAITNAKIFDGERVSDDRTVVLEDSTIRAVGGAIPSGVNVVDADGATLIPGFIDAHVHTDFDGLRDALLFGVTTELEMMGRWTFKDRKKVAERDDIADVRSPGMGVTPPGGHPTEYMKSSGNVLLRLFFRYPFVSTPQEAVRFVNKQVANGADYIKIFIEDGSTIGFPGLPVTSNETLLAAVNEAHRLSKLAIAHVTTVDGCKKAISARVDGLAHIFLTTSPRQIWSPQSRPPNASLSPLW